MNLSTLIPPAAMPLDVADARTHVRQDLTDDDATLLGCIRAARSFAQTECRRTLVATRYRLTLDAFPVGALRLEYGPVLAVRSITYIDTAGAWQTLATSVYVTDLDGDVARIALASGQTWPMTDDRIGAVRVDYDAGSAAAITADATTNVLTIKGGLWRTLTAGDVVRLSNSGGTLPAPLQPDTDYYVESTPTAATFKLAATSGGAAIDITDTGTGTHFIGNVPEDVQAWMRLRIGGLYETREDAAVANGGQMVALPYVDGLLDGSRISWA